MTRRELQVEMRMVGRPWEIGKSFDASGLIGELKPASHIGHPRSGRIWVDVDGQRRQVSDIDQLLWNVAECIAHLSRWFRLMPGDLVYTGTPAGVAAVEPGQEMTGGVDGVGELRVRVGACAPSDGRST